MPDDFPLTELGLEGGEHLLNDRRLAGNLQVIHVDGYDTGSLTVRVLGAELCIGTAGGKA